jgi:hypothetical protein
MRDYRKTAELVAVRTARRAGWDLAMKTVRVTLLEAGDTPLTGFSAAELVRQLGWD